MSSQIGPEIEVRAVVCRNENVHSGDLVFAGTRVPVTLLTENLKVGYAIDEFLESYPTVARWQVDAFLDLSPEAVERMRAHDARAA